MTQGPLHIVTGHDADPLVTFAAEELRAYLSRLFGLAARITAQARDHDASVIYLYAPEAGMDAPDDEQDFLLRRFERGGRHHLLACGGGAAATLWAVYELVERWGVRYLLRGDNFPDDAGAFALPNVDERHRPNLRERGWRLINVLAMGPESWGQAELERVIDQLAKLKFNVVYHQLWCWQPFVHYSCRGFSKSTGTHWSGWHYPIDDQMVGREHFGADQREFVPPAFAQCRNYFERLEAGQQLLRATFRRAAQRGMQAEVQTVLTDFPPEFGPLLGWPPHAIAAWGAAITSGNNLDAPVLYELAAAALRAYVETYPQVDRLFISMPEFPDMDHNVESCWEHIRRRYGLDESATAQRVIEAAKRRVFGGMTEQRLEKSIKGQIGALYFADKLLHEHQAVAGSARPDAKVYISSTSDALAPILSRLQPGGHTLYSTYTTSQAITHEQVFEAFPSQGLKPSLIMTLMDDNIGVLPQLDTRSIARAMDLLRRHGWCGYRLRYWMTCDQDPAAAFIAGNSWDASRTIAACYDDHLTHLYGRESQPAISEALAALHELTVGLGEHAMGLGFPIPPMVIHHWYNEEPSLEFLADDRRRYREIGDRLRSAMASVRPSGGPYLRFAVHRMAFAVDYLDVVERVRQSGRAYRQALQADREVRGNLAQQCSHLLWHAHQLARRALESHAAVVMDQTDLGLLAQMNEDAVRSVKRLHDEVRQRFRDELAKTPPPRRRRWDHQVIATGIPYPEGPVFGPTGELFVCKRRDGAICRIDADGRVHPVAEQGGKPNGLALGPTGELFVADAVRRRIEVVRDNQRVAFVDMADHPLEAPNDLVFDSVGNLYFTDCGSGEVFRISPDGAATCLASGLAFPNGLALDEKRRVLFVAESHRNRIVQIALSTDGEGREPSTFAQLTGGWGPDGMKLDSTRRLYVAHPGVGAVQVLDKNGALVEQIEVAGATPTNLAIRNGALYVTVDEVAGVVRLDPPDDWGPIVSLSDAAGSQVETARTRGSE